MKYLVESEWLRENKLRVMNIFEIFELILDIVFASVQYTNFAIIPVY